MAESEGGQIGRGVDAEESCCLLCGPPDPRSYPPSKTRYLTALLLLPLLLLAGVLTTYLVAGVCVEAQSVRANSFLTAACH